MRTLRITIALLAAAAAPLATPVGAAGLPVPYMVKDLAPGADSLGPDAGPSYCLMPMGDLVLGCSTQFLSDRETPQDEARYGVRLFRSDGTAEGTYQLLPENRSFYAWIPATDEITYLLVAEDHYWLLGGHFIQLALWRTDGTREGTIPLTEFGAVPSTGYLYPIAQYLAGPGRLLFGGVRSSSDETEVDYELWSSDGTAAGTGQLVDLRAETSSAPRNFWQAGGIAYFLTTDPDTFLILARSDGTAAGTYTLPNPLVGDAYPVAVRPGGDGLFVFYQASPEAMLSLWHTDGTVGGFTRLADLGRLATNGLDVLGVGEGTLFFTFRQQSDSGGSVPPQLWASDGTVAGTRELPKPDGARTHDGRWYWRFRIVGGRLSFDFDDGEHGFEPWTSDGTLAGTHILRDFCPGPCSVQATTAAPFVGEVLMNIYGLNPPIEPQVYTPQSGSVRPLADLCPGECVASADVLAQTAGLAYLYTEDAVHGQEIATTDGTAAGTQRTTSFQDDPEPFTHEVLPGTTYAGSVGAVAGGRFFFGADDGEHGYELWAVAVPGSDSTPPPGEPLTSPELPGFETWVRITAGPIETAEPIDGRAEAQCLPETLCVSGAVAGRSEVFVRVVGPKPNGYLWPTLVKFTTSTVDVWLRQISSGELRHYRLDGASPGSSELNGLFDREGFQPE